jgi:hypothetical protein
MRLYTFCNYYLSPIQQGIQSAHCVADMFMKYQTEPSVERVMLREWAKNHKTVVVLNGGNHMDLNSLYLTLRGVCAETGYPFEMFAEDSNSLNCATTCVGIIVPEKIYIYNGNGRRVSQIRPATSWDAMAVYSNPITLTAHEKIIASLLAEASLAR